LAFSVVLMAPSPPRATLSPYTTLFRSKRRDLLQIGALSALGLTLPDWLRMQAAQAADLSSGPSPVRGKVSKGPADVACILLWMRSEEHTSELQSRVDVVGGRPLGNNKK